MRMLTPRELFLCQGFPITLPDRLRRGEAAAASRSRKTADEEGADAARRQLAVPPQLAAAVVAANAVLHETALHRLRDRDAVRACRRRTPPGGDRGGALMARGVFVARVSQPCPRAGQPYCVGIITARPKVLRLRKHCTRACAAAAKHERGILGAPGLEASRRGAQRSAKCARANRKRHLDAMARAVARIEPLIPKTLRDRCSPQEFAALKVLMARAWRAGDFNGYCRGRYGRPDGRMPAPTDIERAIGRGITPLDTVRQEMECL
jgi:hypothetical protein